MKKIIPFIVLLTALCFAGCSDENDTPPVDTIELSTERLGFLNEYLGEQLVTITSTTAWSAAADQSWCKLADAHGEAGTSRLRVSVDPNANIDSREATITISAKGMSARRVKVTQLGEAEEILLLEQRTTVDGEEQQLAVSLVTNVKELRVAIPGDAPWVKTGIAAAGASPAGGGMEKAIPFAIAKNNTREERSATVTFSGGAATAKSFTIIQRGSVITILHFVDVNFDQAIGMRAEGMQLKFDVETTAGDYELHIEGEWLKILSQTGDSYDITLSENPGAARTGKIIIVQPDSEPLLADTLTVNQLGAGEEFVGSRRMDSLSMAAIYRAVDMQNWIPVDGKSWAFNLEKPMEQWTPIRLNSQGRVTHWQILGTIKSDYGFRFIIPAEVQNLTQLKVANISSWNLAKITPEFTALTKLDTLVLQGNLVGEIPATIGNLKSLVYLSISGNVRITPSSTVTNIAPLSGTIPESIYDLTKLIVLRVNNSNVTGAISPSIKNLSNLLAIYMENNRLTDSIPAEIGKLSNLQYLILENNVLTGALPKEIGNLSKLLYLIVDRNRLSGELPASIWAMPELQWFYLYGNQFTGSFPAAIGNMKTLQKFIAFENGFTESIPTSIEQMPALTAFVVDRNYLSGEVSEWLLQKCAADQGNFIICPQKGTTFSNFTCPQQ